MKLGMNLLLYTTEPDSRIFPLAEQLQEMGFDGLEWPVLATDLKTAQEIGKFNAKTGLGATTVYVFGPDANPISPDADARKRAVAAIAERIEVTAALGGEILCGPIVQTLGHFTGKGPTQEEWNWCVEFLRKAGEAADRFNVDLAVEYLNRFEIYFLNTAADACRLCDAVDHPRVKTMVDTFHAHIEEKSQYQAVLDASKHLRHVHISENDRGVPGAGQMIRWDDFFRGIKECGYDGWMTIEAFGTALVDLAAAAKIWRPLFDKPDDVPRQGIAFVKKMLGR